MAEVDPPDCRWFLLIYIDGEPPELRKFSDIGSLRTAIMEAWPEMKMLNDDVSLYVFFGVRAKITKGEQPCLLHPGSGVLVPLYDMEAPIELVEDGVVNQREVPQVTEATEYEDDGEAGYTDWSEMELEDADALSNDSEETEETEQEPFPGDEVVEEEPA